MSEFKMCKLEEKKDYAMYAHQLIIIVYKRIERYKNYIKQLEKLIKDHKLDLDPTRKIPTEPFVEIHDKLESANNFLLNLFGDNSKLSVSYLKFRDIIDKKREKGIDLGLDNLSDELREILNDCNRIRNWSLHVPESLFISQRNFIIGESSESELENMLTDERVLIQIYEYHEGPYVMERYNSVKENYENFRKLFQQLKKDYARLIGKSMRIEKVNVPIPRPLEFDDIPQMSYQINQGKYKKKPK